MQAIFTVMSCVFNHQLENFILSAASLSKVYDFENQKLINRSYANEIFANFSKIVSGTYAIYSKEDRISRLKITIRFNCSQEGCNKKFQMSCLRSAIAEGHDLSFAVASNEEKCEHNGTTPRCRNISAQAREAMKEKLKTTTPRCLYKELVEADDLEGALKAPLLSRQETRCKSCARSC